MIIEDIGTIDVAKSIVQHIPTHLRSKARIIDLQEKLGRWDDILVVLENI